MNKLIMIVDDDLTILTLVDLMLRRLHFSVLKAKDALSALQLLEMSVPDLIILDVMMPDMDGFELCKQLRAHPSTAETPIVFLSARTDSESVTKGFKAGANAYVSKTSVYPDLATNVRKLLGADKLDVN